MLQNANTKFVILAFLSAYLSIGIPIKIQPYSLPIHFLLWFLNNKMICFLYNLPICIFIPWYFDDIFLTFSNALIDLVDSFLVRLVLLSFTSFTRVNNPVLDLSLAFTFFYNSNYNFFRIILFYITLMP